MWALFQSSGILPEDWKSAHITPIHKKGACNLVTSYQPISLTVSILFNKSLDSGIPLSNDLLNKMDRGIQIGSAMSLIIWVHGTTI